jgi:hypothetical protein
MPLDASQPIGVRIAHAASGRVRLRLGQRLEAAAFGALADRLAASPGIRRVVVRPATGSVIIEAATDQAGLLRIVGGLDFMKVLPPEKPVPIGQMAKFGELTLDRKIRDRTDGAIDLRATLALLLLAAAVIQLFRGRVAGPASTLLIAALYFMEESKP